MADRAVLATRRFQKAYPSFLRKYTDLEANLRKLLDFRDTHRPDQAFNATDHLIDKFRRCHLIFGKAILVYQLHGSEIRLVSIDEHNMLERNGVAVREYVRTLGPQDYYLFDVNQSQAKEPAMNDQMPEAEAEAEAEADVGAETQTEPDAIEAEVVEAQHNGVESPMPWWDDKVVTYLHGQQMLYVPRPAKPVIVFTLDKELIAEKGDVLVIDPTRPTVYHMSAGEFDAHFQPASRHTTDLREALSITMERRPERRIVRPRVQPVAEPIAEPVKSPVEPPIARESEPVSVPEPIVDDQPVIQFEPLPEVIIREPEPEPEPVAAEQPVPPVERPVVHEPVPPQTTFGRYMSESAPADVAPQLARLIVVLGYIQQNQSTNKIDSATIREHMQYREADARSLSTTLNAGQEHGYIRKSGSKKGPGRAYYYCLTSSGEHKYRLLGSWPFQIVGLRSPFEKTASAHHP